MRNRLTACLLAGATLTVAGCGDPQERRATLGFSCRAVRQCLDHLRTQLPRRELYPMKAATDSLARALAGLPAKVQKKAATRQAERKAAALKARALFEELQPVLESLKYDEAEMNARLDELAGIIDEVERE